MQCSKTYQSVNKSVHFVQNVHFTFSFIVLLSILIMSGIYINGATIKKQFKISTTTLHRWSELGYLDCIRTPGGARLYSSASVERLFRTETGQPAFDSQKKKIIYARVSSAKQKEDLKRQQDILQQLYPNHELVSDIGSGLNFKRRGFQRILAAALDGDLEEVVVMYRDRLCRFALDLVETIFAHTGTRLVVHSNEDRPHSDTEELADDLLSIVNVFVARKNGLRASRNKRRRKAAIQRQNRDSNEDSQDQSLSKHTTESDIGTVVRDGSMDL